MKHHNMSNLTVKQNIKENRIDRVVKKTENDRKCKYTYKCYFENMLLYCYMLSIRHEYLICNMI